MRFIFTKHTVLIVLYSTFTWMSSKSINWSRPTDLKMDAKNTKVAYIKKNMLWISQTKYPIFSRFVKFLGYILKLFPIPCQFLSSYIYISGNK